MYLFLAITSFPNEEIVLNSFNSKRMLLTVKLGNKKDRSSCSLRKKQYLIQLANLSSKETLGLDSARAYATKIYAQ